MSIPDLIDTLRDWAEVEGAGSLCSILTEAADVIAKYYYCITADRKGDKQ